MPQTLQDLSLSPSLHLHKGVLSMDCQTLMSLV